jgi:hypothetical protein
MIFILNFSFRKLRKIFSGTAVILELSRIISKEMSPKQCVLHMILQVSFAGKICQHIHRNGICCQQNKKKSSQFFKCPLSRQFTPPPHPFMFPPTHFSKYF